MQEWSKTDLEIQNKNARVGQLVSDIASKDAAIAAQERVVASYPQTIQNPIK
jgi:hypothetical protein